MTNNSTTAIESSVRRGGDADAINIFESYQI